MANTIHKISLILKEDRRILKDILILAGHLETEATDQITLENEILNGTVNYYNWIKKLLESSVSRGGMKSVEDLRIILNSMNCFNASEILRNYFSPETNFLTESAKISSGNKQQKKIWNVLNPVTNFVGREEEISKLKAFLDDLEQRILVICGIGGQGKTQLCRKLIKELKSRENCPIIIWLAGESCQALSSSLIAFITTFVQSVDESVIKTFENAMNQALTLVDDEKKVLWVVDNVDTEYPEIEKMATILLAKAENSKIIITSRLRTLLTDEYLTEYLTVESLSLKAAHNLIRKAINEYLYDGDVETLCEEMGYHALALRLSVGFIKSRRNRAGGRGFGIKDFLQIYNMDKKRILQKTEKLSLYERNVLHHVELFVTQLKEADDDTPYKTMLVFSLLRSNGIDYNFLVDIVFKIENLKTISHDGIDVELSIGEITELLHDYAVETAASDETATAHSGLLNAAEFVLKCKTEGKVKEAVDILHSLSLIDAGDLESITVHRLIQDSIRIVFPDWKVIAKSILRHLKFQTLCSNDFQHILTLWNIVSTNNFSLREYAFKVADIFDGLLTHSQIQSLLPFTDKHRQNLAAMPITTASDKLAVIRAELYYGLALLRSGMFQQGLGILEGERRRGGQFLKEIAPTIFLQLESERAAALRMVGRIDESIQLYQSLLKQHNSVYGEEDQHTIALMSNFAVTIVEHTTKVKEALELLLKVLQWREKRLGPLDSETLTTRHNIAVCYLEMGKFVKAKAEFGSVFALRNKVLGEKHFKTLITRSYVAKVLLRSGEYEAAKNEYEGLIKDYTEVMGSLHPSTLTQRQNYVACFSHLEKGNEVKKELEEILQLRIQVLGPNHPDVKTTKTELHLLELDCKLTEMFSTKVDL